MTCCEHCPTLTPEEREDRAFRTAKLNLSNHRHVAVTAREVSKSIVEHVRNVRVTTTVSVSGRTIRPLPPRDPIG